MKRRLTPDPAPLLDLSAHRRREEYEHSGPMWPRLVFEGLVLGSLAVVIIWLVCAL